MEADYRSDRVKGVSEPGVKLILGGRGRGRWDANVFDRLFQAVPVGFVPHGSGGARSSDGAVRRIGMWTWSDPVEGTVEAS